MPIPHDAAAEMEMIPSGPGDAVDGYVKTESASGSVLGSLWWAVTALL
jgi:hypothetical protein